MVKLKKQQLAFMDVYQLWSNRDQAFLFEGNKETCKIIVSQSSDKGMLITEIDYIGVEEFKFNFDTDTFVALIKSLKDDTEITITEKGIEFSGSKYDIKNYDILFEDITNFLNQVKVESGNKIKLADIDKFNYVKNSIGGEGLNTVCYQSKHFVTSDRINYTSFVKTSFDYEKDFYFSSDLFILFNIMGIKDKEINVYDNFYSCKVNNTFILIMNKKYILPNMFDENVIGMYSHPFTFEVSKQEIQTILNRMSIVAKNNKESRIYLELKEGKLIIQNIDSQFASENISATFTPEIENVKIPISVNYLLKIISQFTGNLIRFSCTNNSDDFVAMKIEDETSFNYYALNLLEG